jgi:hypothetical protein
MRPPSLKASYEAHIIGARYSSRWVGDRLVDMEEVIDGGHSRETRFASVAEMRRELIPAIQHAVPPPRDSARAPDQDFGVTRKYDV